MSIFFVILSGYVFSGNLQIKLRCILKNLATFISNALEESKQKNYGRPIYSSKLNMTGFLFPARLFLKAEFRIF